MHRQPPNREDRIVAGGGGNRCLGHGLLQALVKLTLDLVTPTHHWSLALLSLKIGVRARGSKGVIGQARRHEHETSQKDGGQGNRMDYPVTDARNDLEERAFSS